MSSAQTPNTPTHQTPEDLYRDMLHGLIIKANDIATLLHQQIMAQAEAPAPEPTDQPAKPAPNLVAKFDTAARIVRRTILLARAIAKPAPQPAASVPTPEQARRHQDTRHRILKSVEHALGQPSFRPNPAPARRDRLDRLDAPDRPIDLSKRSDAEVITDILIERGHLPKPRRPWRQPTGTIPLRRLTPPPHAEPNPAAPQKTPHTHAPPTHAPASG